MTVISVVPGPRGDSSCLDARSLTLPRCGPGVGRSAKAESYIANLGLKPRGIKMILRDYFASGILNIDIIIQFRFTVNRSQKHQI